MTIAERLEEVRARLARAEERAGRAAGSVRLVAVSKRHPAEAVREAYEAGQRDFGENYPQELHEKALALADLTDLRWHFIGHLQGNKVRLVMPHVFLLHTVDSAHAVNELSRRATLESKRLSVLVQVNVGGEAQKFGCEPQEIEEVLTAIEGSPALSLQGLMTMPPIAETEEAQRRPLAALRTLASLHGGPKRLPELSMGMSDDLEAAVLEGATLVRVGTAIFGERIT
jgi:hypothetical protein